MAGFQSPITVIDVLRRISAHELLLPAFQREFVWKDYQIENLFDSLMQGYPISSMLFWKVKGEAKGQYKFYSFLDNYIERHKTYGDSFNAAGINDFHAVLDGQQRLTSLYIGLSGSYASHRPYYLWKYSEESFPRRFLYLNLSVELMEDDNEKRYLFQFKDDNDTGGKPVWVDTKGNNWFRVPHLLKMYKANKDFDLDDFFEQYDFSKEEKKRLKRLYRVVFMESVINYYEEDDSSPERAVNIFVRINSGGTHLSLSDILFSMVIASWKTDAKEEYNNLVQQVNDMDFNISVDYLLRACLMLFNNEVRYKIKNFTNEFITTVEQHWPEVKKAVLELFRLIKSFGLHGQYLTSANATLPILFYIFYSGKVKDFSTSVAYAQERELMRRWLMKALLLQKFGRSSDTVLSKARSAMMNSDSKSKIVFNEDIALFPVREIDANIGTPTVLGEEEIDRLFSYQKGSKYSFSVLSMLFPALNFADRIFDQDHLHPISSFDDDPENYATANSILNLQLLQDNENKSKNAASLEEWVDYSVKKRNVSKQQVLDEALIPTDTSLNIEDFQDFVKARRELLRDRLLSSLGMRQSYGNNFHE